jgi:hypothetical protein
MTTDDDAKLCRLAKGWPESGEEPTAGEMKLYYVTATMPREHGQRKRRELSIYAIGRTAAEAIERARTHPMTPGAEAWAATLDTEGLAGFRIRTVG